MTPLDAWIARANVERLRLLIATSRDVDEATVLQRLLDEQLAKMRAAEAREPDTRR